jgi:hypothetical protein
MTRFYDAPAQLISEIKTLHGKPIEDIGSLTQCIHRITSNHCCPYSSANTGKNRAVQLYKCSQKYINERDESVSCSAKLELKIVDSIIYVLTSDFRHNHPTDSDYFHLVSQKLTNDECQFIQKSAIFGGSPGFIRGTLGIPILPHKMHYERNKAGQSHTSNEIQELEKNLPNWDGWKVEISKSTDGSHLMFVFFLHSRLIQYPFSSPILIIDDTFCTNKFQLPIVAIIVPDFNQKNQLLAFAYIPDRCQESYQRFMLFLKNCIHDPYCFITDRCLAQIGAIEAIFPSSFILFCRVHIKRNVESKFGNSDVTIHFVDFLFNDGAEDTFVNFIQTNKTRFTETQQRFIERLLKDFLHWAPSETQHILHLGNVTTNRIEGFFGKLKATLDHKLKSLLFVSNAIKSLAETSILKLFKIKKMEVELPEFLMEKADLGHLSRGAITYMENELAKIRNLNVPKALSTDECCHLKFTHGLHCCHLILQRMQTKTPWLSLADFHKLWMLDTSWKYTTDVELSKKFLSCEESINPRTTFIDLSAKFEPFIDAAAKVPEIQERLISCLEDLSKFRVQNFVGHGQLKTVGRPSTHPAAKVGVGRPKNKKTIHCSICHQAGHKKSRHQKNSQTETKIEHSVQKEPPSSGIIKEIGEISSEFKVISPTKSTNAIKCEDSEGSIQSDSNKREIGEISSEFKVISPTKSMKAPKFEVLNQSLKSENGSGKSHQFKISSSGRGRINSLQNKREKEEHRNSIKNYFQLKSKAPIATTTIKVQNPKEEFSAHLPENSCDSNFLELPELMFKDDVPSFDLKQCEKKIEEDINYHLQKLLSRFHPFQAPINLSSSSSDEDDLDFYIEWVELKPTLNKF